MTLAKAVVLDTTKKKVGEFYPLSATVTQYGNKKPDEFNGVFKITDKIKENYEVSYIEDIVDVRNLSYIWNFQMSVRDDGGGDADGFTDPPTFSQEPTESYFTRATSGKFKGHYAYNSVGSVVEVPRAKLGNFDLNRQWDIFAWITPNFPQPGNEPQPIFLSFYDDFHGIEIGLQNYIGDSWYVFVRFGNGEEYTNFGFEQIKIEKNGEQVPIMIRLFRKGNGNIELEVNGKEDSQFVIAGTNLNPVSNINLRFGNGDNFNDQFRGMIHQVRFYNGVNLTRREADTILTAKPQPFTMKFRGPVRNINDKETTKKIQCLSQSGILTNQKLDPELDWPSDINSFPIQSTSFKTIVQNAITALNAPFLVQRGDSFVNTTGLTFHGNIIGIGLFTEFMKILGLLSETVFYTTPRGVFIIESDSGVDTSYVLSQDSPPVYDVVETEEDSIKTANAVRITIDSNTSVYSSVSSADAKRTLRITLRQLDHLLDLENYGTLLAQSLYQTKTKYVVASRAPVHHMRYNLKVNVKNKTRDIDIDDTVAQVDNHYPADKKGNRTYIKVGENDIDMFEVHKITADVENGLTDMSVPNT